MYGNNIVDPFMSPNMSYGPVINPSNTAMMGMRGPNIMGISSQMMTTPRSGGFLSSLFGRSTRGLSGVSSFNFGSLLNNTSKALGVVKEAIPIVKEVGPMMGNMKSILKLASVFKDETDINTTIDTTNITEVSSNENISIKENDTRISSTTTNITNNNEPNFFL